jgi:hypothetical protein
MIRTPSIPTVSIRPLRRLARLAATLALGTLAAAPALANDRDVSIAILRQMERRNRITVSGELTCTMPETNDGRPCALKFTENGTGRNYELTNADGAMRLYQNGQANVVLEGELRDGDTLAVAEARAR